MKKINCLYVVCLIIFNCWKSADGNTYDIPRWLRLGNDELHCPQPTGQFNHPRYCDFFLNCWEGQAVVGKCHDGLVFNEKNRACDYRSKVDCGGRPIAQDPQAPVEQPPAPVQQPPAPPADSRCPYPFGTFPNTADCSQYFVCQGGMATVRQCPRGMDYYNPTLGACDSKRPARCPEIGSGKPQRPPSLPDNQPPSPILEPPPTPVETIENPPPVAESESTSSVPSTSSEPTTVHEIPDHEIVQPSPVVAAGGTPTLAPTTKRPLAPFRPKPSLQPGVVPPFEETPPPPAPIVTVPNEEPSSERPEAPFTPKPPFVPEKPPAQNLEPPSTNAPQTDLNPKPPFVPIVTPKPSTPKPASIPENLVPKPEFVPEESASTEPTQQESISASEKPSDRPPTVSNLKPKPPLKPKPDDADSGKPPLVDLGNLKPKPSFQPPPSNQNPGDFPPPRPPPLNPGSFKPQRPPGPVEPSTTPPPPIDGEDDPNILFPFLPKFPDLFKCPVKTVMLPLVGDCSSLVACVAGMGHRFFCAQGQTFDPVRSRCSSSRNSTCPTEVSNFISGIDERPTPDILYAYLPVSKFSKLLKLDVK